MSKLTLDLVTPTQVVFSKPVKMVVIPGGSFSMGSPVGEPGRYPEEGPQRHIDIRQFAIGKYDVESMYHEAVWIDLTLRLRLWAIENGFDSFVYENKLEGAGEDSYVILAASHMFKPNYEYTFNNEKYLNTVLPIFKQFLQETLLDHSQRFDSASIVQHIFWSGLDPLLFWD